MCKLEVDPRFKVFTMYRKACNYSTNYHPPLGTIGALLPTNGPLGWFTNLPTLKVGVGKWGSSALLDFQLN